MAGSGGRKMNIKSASEISLAISIGGDGQDKNMSIGPGGKGGDAKGILSSSMKGQIFACAGRGGHAGQGSTDKAGKGGVAGATAKGIQTDIRSVGGDAGDVQVATRANRGGGATAIGTIFSEVIRATAGNGGRFIPSGEIIAFGGKAKITPDFENLPATVAYIGHLIPPKFQPSANVKIEIQGLDRTKNIYPGAFINLNNNDDNFNGILDKDENPVTGEKDLVPITISLKLNIVTPGTLELSQNSSSDKIKIWADSKKVKQIILPWEITTGSITKTFYIEGIKLSDTIGDVGLGVEFNSGQFFRSDSIKATVTYNMQLQETRFSSALDNSTTPSTISFIPTAVNTEYHHLGIVSPLVVFDDRVITTMDDGVTPLLDNKVIVSGRVISTVDLFGSSLPTSVLLYVNGNVVAPDENGFFTHTLQQISAHTLITATAFNILGGVGSDTIELDDTFATFNNHKSDNPAFQRIVFGKSSDANFLVGKPVDLQFRSLIDLGTVVSSVKLNVFSDGITVFTEPFIISELSEVRNDPDISNLTKVLKTPPPPTDSSNDLSLFHNLYVVIDNKPLRIFELAGVRFLDPPPFSIFEVDADDTLTILKDVKLNLRNVSERNLKIIISSDVSGIQTDITSLLKLNADPNSLNPAAADNGSFLIGNNDIKFDSQDLSGRKIQSKQETTFIQDKKVKVFNKKQLGDAEKFVKESKKFVNFKLKPGIPASVISRECKRLGMNIAGYVKEQDEDSCGNVAVYSIIAEPQNGNLDLALQALKASPIHEEADPKEQPNIIGELKEVSWPIGSGWWSQQFGIKSYDAAKAFAQHAKNNIYTKKVQDVMGTGKISNKFFFVDARIDNTRFDPGDASKNKLKGSALLGTYLKAAVSMTEPLNNVKLKPPFYKHLIKGDTKKPTYEIREAEFNGVDQNTSGNFQNGAKLESGAVPRVYMSHVFKGQGKDALKNIITKDTKGIIITVHGFNVSSNLKTGFEHSEIINDPLRNYWPFTQYLYRTFISKNLTQNNNPDISKDFVVLHVSWTGDFSPKDALHDPKSWFNWDEALARDSGDRVVYQIVRDIVEIKDEMEPAGSANKGNKKIDDPNWLGITVHAESLGCRLAVSMFNKLREEGLFPVSKDDDGKPKPGVEVTYPVMRFVMAHPALRRFNMLKTNLPLTDPDTNLQRELQGLNEYANQKILMFYSEFDKRGIPYNAVQQTEKLGRCGLPPAYDPNDPAKAIVVVKQIFANKDNQFIDLWHVDLFGWNIPGMYIESTPTYSWNAGLLSILHITASNLRSTDIMIEIKNEHIDPIFGTIADYVLTGQIPD